MNLKKFIIMTMATLYIITASFSTVYAENEEENSAAGVERSLDAGEEKENETVQAVDGLENVTQDDGQQNNTSTEPNEGQETESADAQQEEEPIPDPPSKSSVLARSVCVMDANTGFVIYNKDMAQKNFPASITKIMTTLLALEYVENGGSLNERVYMTDTAVFGIEPAAANIAMNVGETLSLRDALYAVMLRSANEVAIAVGEHIGGTQENFAWLMTQKAKSIGAVNTNFTNASGLHSSNHYTTAYDMALIMKEALRYDLFKTLISTTRYTIGPTERQSEPRILLNTNKLIDEASEFYYPSAVGSKTGFTDQAQHTLVTYGVDGESELIVVCMYDEKNGPYVDTAKLMDFGFTQFQDVDLLVRGSHITDVNVGKDGMSARSVPLVAARGITAYVPLSVNPESVVTQIDVPDSVNSELEKGEVVGNLRIFYDGVLLGSTELITTEALYALIPQTIGPAVMEEAEPVFANQSQELTATSLTEDLFLPIALMGGGVLVLMIIGVASIARARRKRRVIIHDYRYHK